MERQLPLTSFEPYQCSFKSDQEAWQKVLVANPRSSDKTRLNQTGSLDLAQQTGAPQFPVLEISPEETQHRLYERARPPSLRYLPKSKGHQDLQSKLLGKGQAAIRIHPYWSSWVPYATKLWRRAILFHVYGWLHMIHPDLPWSSKERLVQILKRILQPSQNTISARTTKSTPSVRLRFKASKQAGKNVDVKWRHHLWAVSTVLLIEERSLRESWSDNNRYNTCYNHRWEHWQRSVARDNPRNDSGQERQTHLLARRQESVQSALQQASGDKPSTSSRIHSLRFHPRRRTEPKVWEVWSSSFKRQTIYRVFIWSQDKVIWVKDPRIFENTSKNDSNSLLHFEEQLEFEGFFATDQEWIFSDHGNFGKRQTPRQSSRPQASFRTGRALKPTSKVQENDKTKKAKQQKTPSFDYLITWLIKLLDTNWKYQVCTSIFSTRVTTGEKRINANITSIVEEDLLKILVAKLISEANAEDETQFVFFAQFDVKEPEIYNRAMSGVYAPKRFKAMRKQLDQLKKNNIWSLVWKDQIPLGHRPLGGKWVYKVKRDVNRIIARCKARWVVRGYLKQFGVEFDQMFAEIGKRMAFRVLFAIAVVYDLDIDQMDVKTTFLYWAIDQLLSVEMPKGYYNEYESMVYRLNKAFYGLKQSPHLWYKRLSSFLLEKLGLTRINSDHSIFITRQGLEGLFVSTFVYEIKIMGPKNTWVIARVKMELTAAFKMVDMGPISFYLGLKVDKDREKRTIKLSESEYIQKVRTKYHLDNANPTNTRMKEVALWQNSSTEAAQAEKEKYQGWLIHWCSQWLKLGLTSPSPA